MSLTSLRPGNERDQGATGYITDRLSSFNLSSGRLDSLVRVHVCIQVQFPRIFKDFRQTGKKFQVFFFLFVYYFVTLRLHLFVYSLVRGYSLDTFCHVIIYRVLTGCHFACDYIFTDSAPIVLLKSMLYFAMFYYFLHSNHLDYILEFF